VKYSIPLADAPWNGEKNYFSADTIKAALVLEMHFQDLSCIDFYTMVLDNLKLLQEISSAAKCKNLSTQGGINCKQNLVNENM
jgi:hypothetical protein